MFQRRYLMLFIGVVSILVTATFILTTPPKVVEAQYPLVSTIYVEAKVDSTGNFTVPYKAFWQGSCKPKILGAVISAQANNNAWYSVPVIDEDQTKLARRGDQFFSWRDYYEDPNSDHNIAIAGRVSGYDAAGPIRLVLFLIENVC